MLNSGVFFQAVALPYELLTRHPIWERHCARMATELPAGARRVLDLGCGPGNSTTHVREAAGSGAFGADPALSMLRRARKRNPALSLVCADGTRLPITTETIYREGDSPAKESAAKIGGGAVGGAVLGAILGGKKGAIIGSTVGAGAGGAAVAASEPNVATLPAGSTVTVRMSAPATVTVEK